MISEGKRRRASHVLVIVILFLIGCQAEEEPYRVLDGQAQGTTFHIVYDDPEDRDFSMDLDSLFKLMDKSMSLWVDRSVISRVNDNEQNLQADDHFIRVFKIAQDIATRTDGALDVTISPLIRLWKIDQQDPPSIPDAAAIDSVLEFTGFRNVTIDYGIVRKKDPRMKLDFNAIAQGYTVDLISQYLEGKGILNYLVEVGGELRAKGVNPRNKYWQVGIDKPVDGMYQRRELQVTIPLRNASLATSGNYRKYKEVNGKKYSHIINPKTGYPANQQLLSVSVLTDECTMADGYATAFLVMGLTDAMHFAIENKIAAYFIYVDEQGAFAVEHTPDFPI